MPTLADLQKDLATKRGELNALFTEHKTDQKDENGNPVFKSTIPLDEVTRRGEELTTLQQQFDAAKSVDEAYQRNDAELKGLQAPARQFRFGGAPEGEEAGGIKSVTDQFLNSPGYKSLKDGNRNQNGWGMEVNISMKSAAAAALDGTKSLFSESGTGYVPYPAPQPYIIYSAQRRPVVADLIPQDDTNAAIIIYLEETTFTNAAAAVSEGATKPNSALGLTRRSVPMSKIATTLQVTDETMMDIPQIETYLRNRLGFGVQLEEERELLLGSGTLPELTGFLNKSGVLTQPKSTDDVFSAVYKGITKVNSTTGFADTSGIVMHPTDWVTFRTTKDSQGRFILGDPGAVGPNVLWGVPVIVTPIETLGTILLGDFRTYSHIDRKLGLRIDVGYVNDDFQKNQSTLRAEERLALEIYRAAAFCLVTGV